MNAAFGGRYFCEGCTRRYATSGDCPHCADEPLLDLLDEDVLLFLESMDRTRWRRRTGLCSVVSGVACLPLLGLTLIHLHLGILAWFGGVFLLSAALMKAFPPEQKCPDMGQGP